MDKKGNYYIVGNWKMNPGDKNEARKIFNGVKKASQRKKSEIVICPPFPYLGIFSSERLPKSLHLGAQNCFFKERGSFTGEVSPKQLLDLKVEYVIVGHSERRSLGESDEFISKKIRALLDLGIKPIVCIGESQRDKNGNYIQFLESQLSSVFSEVKTGEVNRVIVAYEPVWAIGKNEGEAITGRLLYEMVVFVRRFLSRRYSKEKGFSVSVLYGGSVSSVNTKDILEEGKVDGLLIGRSSLDSESFSEIISIAEDL